MNRFMSLKSLAPALLVLGTLAAATTAAQAHSDVQLAVTLGVPGVYVQTAPVYAYPRPVVVQPAPVYSYPQLVYEQRAPAYAYPQPVYVERAPAYGWGYQHHHYYERHENERRENAQGPWGDRDHDGTPNRYDRFPWNPNRR